MSNSTTPGAPRRPHRPGGEPPRAAAAGRLGAPALTALIAAASGSVGAQPGPRIDLSTQTQPAIQVERHAPPSTIDLGNRGPAAAANAAGNGADQPRVAPAEAPYASELERLRQVASPRTGFGSTQAAADAAWTLGLLDLHGGVGPLSPRQAATWFQRATAHNRQPLAWAGVAWCAIDGCESPPNAVQAQAAINHLRKVQQPRALFLQWLLDVVHKPVALADADTDTGLAPTVLPHLALLQQAARAGDAPAQVELGISAAARGDFPLARRYFSSAASRSPAARANLRLLDQREPNSNTEQESEADRLLAQAQRFHRGSGVPMNYVEAIRLYQQAARAGSLPARRMLELIVSRPTPQGSINVAWMAQLAQIDPTSNLPALDDRRFAGILERDPTPLFDLIPAPWKQRVEAQRR